MKSKAFWKSKTFWVNIIAIGAMVVQSQTEYVLDATTQATALAMVNLILRAVTRESVVWGAK